MTTPFIRTFWQTRGAVNLVLVALLLSMGIGVMVPILPGTLATRFAHQQHGLDPAIASCNDLSLHAASSNQAACAAGAHQAARAAATWNLVAQALTLVATPWWGRLSDLNTGRKPVLLVAVAVVSLPAWALWWMLRRRSAAPPIWYYAANGATGLVDNVSLLVAALADLVASAPQHTTTTTNTNYNNNNNHSSYATAAFGLLMGAMYGGFSLSPALAWWLHPGELAAVAVGFHLSALVLVLLGVPETTRAVQRAGQPNNNDDYDNNHDTHPNNNDNNPNNNDNNDDNNPNDNNHNPSDNPNDNNNDDYYWPRCDPRLAGLAVIAFLSNGVLATDANFVLYFAQDQLDVQPSDLSALLLVMGVAGLAVQWIALPWGVRRVGPHALLIASCVCGAVHNGLYSTIRHKSGLYAAFCLSQFTKVDSTVLASLTSQLVPSHEQGQWQGALASLGALAQAVTPIGLQQVVVLLSGQRNSNLRGVFGLAAGWYVVAAVVAARVAMTWDDTISSTTTTQLQEPLLSSSCENTNEDTTARAMNGDDHHPSPQIQSAFV